MIAFLKKHDRYKETVLLGTLSLFSFAVSIFRAFYTQSLLYLGLNWNLFLAFIPWMITSLLIIKPNLRKRKPFLVLMMTTWLLFFPNAPYILTDLFHLQTPQEMPLWFDLMQILSFAWTGLLFGILSLWDMERMLTDWVSLTTSRVISFALLFIGSFGVYLGRDLRWNSWDIVTHTPNLMLDVANRVLLPFEHKGTWGMTILMGAFLCIVYSSLRFVQKRA